MLLRKVKERKSVRQQQAGLTRGSKRMGQRERQEVVEFGSGWRSPGRFGPTDGNLVLGRRDHED